MSTTVQDITGTFAILRVSTTPGVAGETYAAHSVRALLPTAFAIARAIDLIQRERPHEIEVTFELGEYNPETKELAASISVVSSTSILEELRNNPLAQAMHQANVAGR